MTSSNLFDKLTEQNTGQVNIRQSQNLMFLMFLIRSEAYKWTGQWGWEGTGQGLDLPTF